MMLPHSTNHLKFSPLNPARNRSASTPPRVLKTPTGNAFPTYNARKSFESRFVIEAIDPQEVIDSIASIILITDPSLKNFQESAYYLEDLPKGRNDLKIAFQSKLETFIKKALENLKTELNPLIEIGSTLLNTEDSRKRFEALQNLYQNIPQTKPLTALFAEFKVPKKSKNTFKS